MSSTLNKRVKEVSNIDRLSELPDSIIIGILSLLKVDESAITAVLSRRWQHLWTQSPKLSFRQGTLLVPDFVARVNRTLLSCSPGHLNQIAVDFEYTKPFACDVNAWVQFAVTNKVERVTFLLNTLGNIISEFYVLPQLMCSNSSLGSLCIKGCTIAPQRTVYWPCLKYLFIQGVEVEQSLIAKILSGSPVLSFLSLKQCWGFNCLEIKSKRLINICIVDRVHEGINNGPLLEISAPYIESLEIGLSCPDRRKLRLTNISSDVYFDIEFIGCDFQNVEVMNNAKELLGNIQNVNDVEMGPNFVEVLSCMAIKYGSSQFPQSTSRTSLMVNADRERLGHIHGILGLLESSPNLQELVIEGHCVVESVSFPAVAGDLERDLLQLKTVIIQDFVLPNLGGEPMLMLARILLNRAPVLEKMLIYIKEISKSSPELDPIKILETLFSFPRSSQKALFLFR